MISRKAKSMAELPTLQSFSITDSEKRLLRRMAKGKTDRTIAAEIGGTEKQVTEQRLALISRLCIQSNAQLLAVTAVLAAWPAKKNKKTTDRPEASVRRDT